MQDHLPKRICPYLRSIQDQKLVVGYPTKENRCHVCPDPKAVTYQHQELYCLEAHHRECPVYNQPQVAQRMRLIGKDTSLLRTNLEPGVYDRKVKVHIGHANFLKAVGVVLLAAVVLVAFRLPAISNRLFGSDTTQQGLPAIPTSNLASAGGATPTQAVAVATETALPSPTPTTAISIAESDSQALEAAGVSSAVEIIATEGVTEVAAVDLITKTLTPTNTFTATPTFTSTPTETPTSTDTVTNTPTSTPLPPLPDTNTPTDLPTHTATSTDTPLPSETPAPSETALPTETFTAVPSSTTPPTNTLEPKVTVTLIPSNTPRPEPTFDAAGQLSLMLAQIAVDYGIQLDPGAGWMPEDAAAQNAMLGHLNALQTSLETVSTHLHGFSSTPTEQTPAEFFRQQFEPLRVQVIYVDTQVGLYGAETQIVDPSGQTPGYLIRVSPAGLANPFALGRELAFIINHTLEGAPQQHFAATTGGYWQSDTWVPGLGYSGYEMLFPTAAQGPDVDFLDTFGRMLAGGLSETAAPDRYQFMLRNLPLWLFTMQAAIN